MGAIFLCVCKGQKNALAKCQSPTQGWKVAKNYQDYIPGTHIFRLKSVYQFILDSTTTKTFILTDMLPND